jgi:hypothetical protein
MSGIRVVLIACLVSLCGVAWAADAPPTIPAGARIGIIDMVTNDITHYHVGKSEVGNFLRTYRGTWVPQDLIDDPLIAALAGAGFQPVVINPSPTLAKDRESWIIRNPRSEKLPRGCIKELGRILAEQNLAALVIAAPGANSEPAFDSRQRLMKLPETTQGFGFSTSDEPDGITKPAVFDFTQFVVVAKTEDGPELVTRDWGGGRLYDWDGFDGAENLKSLNDGQIGQLRPVFAEAVKTRIDTRVMPRFKP